MDFHRASSGMPGLDGIIDDLRLGDNVVWQVDQIEDYAHFARQFAAEAIGNGKRLVYFRFGEHPPLLESFSETDYVYCPVDAKQGFEHFAATIRKVAGREGEGVYYIFDCLSELLTEWCTDWMIGNFFMITCPYLFRLNTIAYFALLRECHSYATIARIRETTQLLLDLYHADRFYIHPLKVWQRYSPTMYLPHVESGEAFIPLTDSADATRFFSQYPQRFNDAERQIDYWDHVFLGAADLAATPVNNDPRLVELQATFLEQLLTMVISRDERILALARRYFSIQDLMQIKDRLIGSGFIGGKAVGLLLARKIVTTAAAEWADILEPHDSFYIGSDVFYTYLVENGCWDLRQDQKAPQNYFQAAAALKEQLSRGSFPEMVREQFLEMLEYFGQSPFIVRSSSLLEDGFGNAFAGKYESVFCANQGTLQERYEEFINAIRTVYASTMNEDALAYRMQRGLADRDEQMALLVQRVSGSYRGAYFFPDLAGVALSHNLYVWQDEMDPAAGMLRMVVGLGTRAVDRSGDDYARIVALDRPLVRPEADSEECITFSQHQVDLLHLAANRLETRSFQDIVSENLLGNLPLFAGRDPRDHSAAGRWIINFENLLHDTDFSVTMRKLLHTLQTAYGYPVDTEFTANFRPDGSYHVNLLQCRPLQVKTNRQRIVIPPDIPPDRIVFESRSRFMGGGTELKLARLVWVVPEVYAELSQVEKYQLARMIGAINRSIPDQELLPTMLLGPGRWGTSTPSLGVPVSFAEINRFAILGELAFTISGFVPELSYGTHFFQDLVETDIFYLTLNEAEPSTRFNREFLTRSNALTRILPEAEEWQHAIFISEEADWDGELWVHADVTARKVTGWVRPTLASPAAAQ